MSDIITVLSSGVLSVELNRPAKKNAMTAGMYTTLAGIFREAAVDEEVRVVVWGGSGKILKSALREHFWIDQKRAVG